jgi:FO synthase
LVRLDSEVAAALRVAERTPGGLSEAQALALMTADGPALEAVAGLADGLRHDAVGDEITYVVNRNINFTNVCYTGCRFCAFAQRATDADAYTLSVAQIEQRVREAAAAGATEVCMQGGIDPAMPATVYFDLARAVKRAVPGMHLHAFSPMEIVNGASRSNLSISDWLVQAREAGLDSIPERLLRSSTMRCGGCSPRASCRPVPGSRSSPLPIVWALSDDLDDDVRPCRSA